MHRGNAKHLRNFGERKTREVTQVHELRTLRIGGGELGQGGVEGQQIFADFGGGHRVFVDTDMDSVAAAFEAPFPTASLNQDPAYGLGGGGEEMAAVVPARLRAIGDQPQVGLMDERGRLKGLPRFFLGELVCRQLRNSS